jgi:hypothetical protein
LERGQGGRGGERLFARGGGYDGDELEFVDGGSRDVNSLGVGAGVGRGQKEPSICDEIVQKGDVDWGQALELVLGAICSAKSQTEPEAFGAGASEEGASDEPFGVERVRQIEVADVADVFYIAESKSDNPPTEIKEIDGLVVDKSRSRQITGKGFSCESSHDDLFAGRGHVLADCRMGRYGGAKKLSEE